MNTKYAASERGRAASPPKRSLSSLDPALLFAALQVMPVEWKRAADYETRREEAESRIAARDPDDWPTVALALAVGVPVWSHDKDRAGVHHLRGKLLVGARVLGSRADPRRSATPAPGGSERAQSTPRPPPSAPPRTDPALMTD